MQEVTEYDVLNISDTQPRNNMITMGLVDTSDIMMIITWSKDYPFNHLNEMKHIDHCIINDL